MSKTDFDNEFQTMFHLVLIGTMSVFGILLVAMMLLSGWDAWPIPLILIGIVSVWFVHFSKIGNPDGRLYYYIVILCLGIFYYGSEPVALTDVPMVICLFVVILAANQSIILVCLLCTTYLVLLLYHFFVTHYIGLGMEQLVLARVVLSVVCLSIAIGISNFFIRRQKQDRSLQQAAQEKLLIERRENERFLANVSHELRTPINAVNGISEILLKQELDGAVYENVEAIQNAGRRLYAQVSDILDYSELMTKRLKLSKSEYEPVSVINDAVANVLWKKMDPRLDFAIDIAPDMPKVLYGDSRKIRKILIALMDNAIKFTEAGGCYLYISKRDEEYGINLNIDIWDTGCGMDKETQKHLYSGFYMNDSSVERKNGGLGLGLAIVHGMVAAMSGFMKIDSEVNKGTHIHISIPQRVRNRQASIFVQASEKYHIACYFNKGKYVDSRVGSFYYQMISHIRSGLNIQIHEAESVEHLKRIIEQSDITHVFIARWEYELDKEFFNQLSEKYTVCIFADNRFKLPEKSQIHIIYKPVYMMQVTNILNATTPGMIHVEKNEKQQKFHGRVLVVDDDNMNLIVAKGILKTFGLDIETCLSGAAAIEKCMFTDYDLIFMDYMMPGMNGVETLHQIRSIHRGGYNRIPVVALTANAVSGAREMFLDEGFDEFIAKPIELSEMSRVLRKLLAKGEETE